MTPEEAVTKEFETQYIADELMAFTREFVESFLPRWAYGSVVRIARATGWNVDGCRQLLLELRPNPNFPPGEGSNFFSNLA
jgi:hypothetical protein